MNEQFTCDMPDIVFYHFPCADGYGARYAIEKFMLNMQRIGIPLSNEPIFIKYNYETHIPLQNGENIVDTVGKHVLFVDCSPATMEQMNYLAETSASVTILDHHKTAFERIDEYVAKGNSVITTHFASDNPWSTRSGMYAKLSRGNICSGALITRNYFLASDFADDLSLDCSTLKSLVEDEDRTNKLLRYVSDRDTWRWKRENSREINEVILAHPYSVEEWDAAAQYIATRPDAARECGVILQKKRRKDTLDILEHTCKRRDLALWTADELVGTFSVYMANIPYTMVSEAAEYTLNSPKDLFIGYYVNQRGENVVSFRSTGKELDVSAVAKLFGGGGHFNAAGARYRGSMDSLLTTVLEELYK